MYHILLLEVSHNYFFNNAYRHVYSYGHVYLKGKLLMILGHFIHVLQYYLILNNKHHTKPSNLYVC